MKIKRLFLLISILCFSLTFTACGESLYTMSDEEEAIIVAYASKAVSKFNKNQTIGIANARVKPGELDEDYEATSEGTTDNQEEEATEPEIDPVTGEPIITDFDETEGLEETVEDGSTDSTSQGLSFTKAMDIEGVEFTCLEFDVSTEYKTNNFALTSVSGKQYVVLSIEAENTTDKSIDFSQFSKKTYSLSLNGGEKTNNQYTPLSNDLANYNGILAAGDTKSFVLVFLFSNSSVENISSLELFVTSDGTTRGTTI